MSDFIDISSSSSSAVWKYFLKNKIQQTAKCKECKTKTTILSSKGGTTSSFKSHLKTKHNIAIDSKTFSQISQQTKRSHSEF